MINISQIFKNILLSLLFLYFGAYSKSINIDLNSDLNIIYNEIDKSWGLDFILNDLEVGSDIFMDNFEKDYLIQLKSNTIITKDSIKNALYNLKKKNHFDSVEILIKRIKSEPAKRDLIIKLKSFWIFSKLKIKGRLGAKDIFSPSYMFEFGEKFVHEKHLWSLDNVKKDLNSQGYLNAKVIDNLKFDHTTKSVAAILSFENLERFKISDLEVNFLIKDSNITGLKDLKNKLIRLGQSELVGNYYDKNILEKFALNLKKYLLKKGYISSRITFESLINHEKSKVKLIFEVEILQKQKFVFFGNHFFKTIELLDQISIFGSSTLQMPPAMIADHIIDIYKKRGFLEVQVKTIEEKDGCYFIINEGPQAKIIEIEIEGIDKDLSSELIYTYFTAMINSPIFNVDILKSCQENLAEYFLKNGFWEFNILKEKTIKLESGKYKLVLFVETGEQKFIESVILPDFVNLSDNKVFSDFINLSKPVIFDVNILKNQREVLASYLKSSGYIYVSVNPEFIGGKTPNSLILKWQVRGPDQPSRFGKTIVQTNSKLPFDIIMRELTYQEGQVWDKYKLDSSVSNLKRLSIFDSVNLTPVDINKAEINKDLILKASLDDPFELRTRAGFQVVSKNIVDWSGGYSYKLGGSFLHKNPLNKADIAKMECDFSRYKSEVMGSYQVPWIFNRPIKTTLKGYRIRYDQPFVFGSPEILYKAAQDGILVEFNKGFKSWDLISNFGCEFMKITDLSSRLAALIDYAPILVNRKIPYLFLESSAFFDRLDNQLDPHWGTLTVMSAKFMGAPNLRESFFLKLLLEHSYFRALTDNAVLGLRLRAGYILNKQFSIINPIERFYLGGAFSVRGYEQDKAPPVNFTALTSDGTPDCIVQLGGKAMVNINAELRFPLYQALSGVVFNDIGALAQDKITDIITSNFVGSTGFGLRYKTPVGPLRFDIGFKWKKRFENDCPYAWFLTLGQAF